MTIKEERQLRNYIKGLIRESISEEMWDYQPIDKQVSENPDVYDYDPRLVDEIMSIAVPELQGVDQEEIRTEVEDALKRYMDEYYDDDPDINPNNELWDDVKSIADSVVSSLKGAQGDSPAGLPGDDEITSPYEDEDDKGMMARLHYMMEGMARDAVRAYLNEGKKKKGSKKTTRSKDGKKKGSKDKTSSSEKTIVSRLNNDAVNSAHYFYKLYGVEDGTDDEKAAARSLGYKKAKGKKLPGKNGHYKFSSKERNRLNAMLTTDKN